MLYLGIDGGGTKCHAVIENEQGQVIGRGRGGPANPVHGVEQTFQSILEATSQALVQAGFKADDYSKLIAGIGLAGVNIKAQFNTVNAWKHPFAKMYLTTDLDIANTGAHEGEDGAVIIIGTGSCGYVRVNKDQCNIGGHGFPIGDKASGAWLGLKAIEHTLLAQDGISEESYLSKKVMEFFNVNTALSLSEAIVGKPTKNYAQLAKLIFDAAEQGKDEQALLIINESIDYVTKMANKLLEYNPQRISMIGGLSNLILDRLEPGLAEKFDSPLRSPEIGALIFAKQNWLKTEAKIA
jgi:glucosamine kinase